MTVSRHLFPPSLAIGGSRLPIQKCRTARVYREPIVAWEFAARPRPPQHEFDHADLEPVQRRRRRAFLPRSRGSSHQRGVIRQQGGVACARGK
jgi:hypothetical protein